MTQQMSLTVTKRCSSVNHWKFKILSNAKKSHRKPNLNADLPSETANTSTAIARGAPTAPSSAPTSAPSAAVTPSAKGVSSPRKTPSTRTRTGPASYALRSENRYSVEPAPNKLHTLWGVHSVVSILDMFHRPFG